MEGYRRHRVSKLARKLHKRREQKRKEKYGGLAAFFYQDVRNLDPARLSPTRNRGKLR